MLYALFSFFFFFAHLFIEVLGFAYATQVFPAALFIFTVFFETLSHF